VTIDHLGDWGTQFGLCMPVANSGEDLRIPALKVWSALCKGHDSSQGAGGGKVSPEDADKPDVNQMAREYLCARSRRRNSPELLEMVPGYFPLSILRRFIPVWEWKFDHHLGRIIHRSHLSGIEQ